jgi:hypothetical protein
MRGHNTGEYYQCLMYVGLRTLGSLHKNSCIGPGLCELPRITLPRRWVNKGKKRKGVGLASPTISAQALSGSVSDSLGRHLQFKSRRHTLGGLGQDER